jgi:hypothetical protein
LPARRAGRGLQPCGARRAGLKSCRKIDGYPCGSGPTKIAGCPVQACDVTEKT